MDKDFSGFRDKRSRSDVESNGQIEQTDNGKQS
ncbi:hypothetical protein E2C01_016010 [Portunus trituberculatus]|uniref:Uncharacterized protein n=1 Tax=Portunus trituberculatus TaxID=210409 RepID=A0A5B7DNF3_PORTR|nr:hypothetical protein [Portunus trituberculatus]